MTREDRAGLHERFVGWLKRESPDQPLEIDEILGSHLELSHTHRRATGTTP
jgi:hypothetical protein